MSKLISPSPGVGGPACAALVAWLALGAPAAAQTASDVRCAGCVNSGDIANGAVKTADLRSQAVTTAKIAPAAVDRSRIEDGAIIWKKLALSLQERILELESRLAALEANTVLALDERLRLEQDARGPLVVFEGVNLQVLNGAGGTETVNGLGNLVVGYDERGGYATSVCSDGQFDNRDDCVAAGGRWAREHKNGSHYLVVGSGHRYSRYGGLVAGDRNTVNGDTASAFGGSQNMASGDSASVTGGFLNEATGFLASVGGGTLNIASGDFAAVGGGSGNQATGSAAAVTGGEDNEASGRAASVNGGSGNTASGDQGSVGGGLNNGAEGTYAAVGAGEGNVAAGVSAAVNGGSGNRADGDRASVHGGDGNVADGEAAAVSGGRLRSTADDYDWAAGGLIQDQ